MLLVLKTFWSAIFVLLFFCHDFHECHFVLKFSKHTKHLSKFTAETIQNILIFFNYFLILLFIRVHLNLGPNRTFDLRAHLHIKDKQNNLLPQTHSRAPHNLRNLVHGWERSPFCMVVKMGMGRPGPACGPKANM